MKQPAAGGVTAGAPPGPVADGDLEPIPEKARLQTDAGACSVRGFRGARRLFLRRSETRGAAAALRLPAGAERRAEELGGHQGTQPRSGRQAAGGACRGSSAGVRLLRGRHPQGPVRRRHGDGLGSRPLGARGRPGKRLRQGQALVPPVRRAAEGPLDAGAHGRARRARGGLQELAADQVQRRVGDGRARATCWSRTRTRAASQASGRWRRSPQAADRVWTSEGEVAPSEVSRRAGSAAARKPPTWPFDLASLGTPAPELPEFVPPELATLVDKPPTGEDWVHEIKFDGYRTQCRIESGRAWMRTRTGLDWTERFRPIADAAARLPVGGAILDGEIVALEPSGVPSFALLQETLKTGPLDTLVYYVFDLLFLEGRDLRGVPLEQRKSMLQALIGGGEGPHPLFRSSARQRPAVLRERLPHGAGGRGFEAAVSALQVGADPGVAEVEVHRTAGVRHRRLHQADHQGARHRRAAARLLRQRGQAHLRRPRRHRLQRADLPRIARAARWHPRRKAAFRDAPGRG